MFVENSAGSTVKHLYDEETLVLLGERPVHVRGGVRDTRAAAKLPRDSLSRGVNRRSAPSHKTAWTHPVR